MANGAKELQVNETSQNFEYDIELEQWEKVLDRAKQLFQEGSIMFDKIKSSPGNKEPEKNQNKIKKSCKGFSNRSR